MTIRRQRFLRWGATSLLCLFVLLGNQSFAPACTVVRFNVDGRLIVARNHDWPFGEGMLVVNQRGIQKSALSPVNPHRWTSRYGSVSLVQFGREIPFAGMNERGLTVDLLQLLDAQFPAPDPQRASVNVVQWVQYQLDTAASVEEVIASLQTVVPVPMLPMVERVHYFVTDASGDVAVIEFLDGRAVVQHGTEAAQCALANSTWSQSSGALLGQGSPRLEERRYVRAVQAIDQMPSDASASEQVDFAFATLDRVAQRDLTQWNLVYEPAERRIWFQTKAAPRRRWIDLDALSFEATGPTLVLDVDADLAADVTPHLSPYTDQHNQRIVHHSFGRLMPAGLPRAAIKQLVLGYPETLKVSGEPIGILGAQ